MAHVLIACAKRYNGHELWTLLGVLRQRQHTFEVVSQELLIKDELTLRPNMTTRTLYDVDPSEAPLHHDGMIVVSGNMDDTEAYWTDPHMEACLKAFKETPDKLLAAICCSVPTLAPVATGVHVSYFPLVRSKQRLQKYGAILENVSITVDGRHITAENQMMTTMWGEEISNYLEGKPPQYQFRASGFTPKGSNRLLERETQEMIDQARLAKGLPLTPAAADGRRFKDDTPHTDPTEN